jgi:uncharacterized protein with PIN domain
MDVLRELNPKGVQGMARLMGESAVVVQRNQERLERMAAELAEALYGPDGMPWGTRFSELEDSAFELGQALARRLMQRMVRSQAADSLPCELKPCPRCGRELGALPDEDSNQEARVLTTRSGEVEWCEPKRHCPTCRRDFFPSSQEFGNRSVSL